MAPLIATILYVCISNGGFDRDRWLTKDRTWGFLGLLAKYRHQYNPIFKIIVQKLGLKHTYPLTVVSLLFNQQARVGPCFVYGVVKSKAQGWCESNS